MTPTAPVIRNRMPEPVVTPGIETMDVAFQHTANVVGSISYGSTAVASAVLEGAVRARVDAVTRTVQHASDAYDDTFERERSRRNKKK